MQMETRVLPEPCADFLMRVRTVIIEDTVDIEEFVGALITLFQKFQELLMPVPLAGIAPSGPPWISSGGQETSTCSGRLSR